MLTCSQEQAIKRVQQNDEGGLIIQFLMRSFEDIFRTKKKIDINQLSRFLNINNEKINRYLILLEKQNMIELEFLNTDISIYWKLPREDQFTLNVFLKIPSLYFSMCSRSHACLNSVNLFNIGYNPKFIEPIFKEATSGLNKAAGAIRSSTVICIEPPVVILTTAFVDCFILGKNCSYIPESCDGFPVSGSLACKCKIAAPASAAGGTPSGWLQSTATDGQEIAAVRGPITA